MKVINWLRVKNYLIHFIIVQLFLTLISFPIIVIWGLPLSILSPIGNLIFAPLLSLFLLISSLLFFCELLYIPNTWFAYFLEKITYFWNTLLSWKLHFCLFGFTQPSFWFLLLIPAVAFFIVTHAYFRPPERSIIALSLLLIFACTTLKVCYQPCYNLYSIPCNQGSVTLICENGAIILIDPGYIGQRPSALSWVNYTLIPEVIKHTGQLTIDYCITLKINARTLEALVALSNKMTIKNLYMPKWQNKLPYFAWKHFCNLKKNITESNGIYRIINEKNRIVLSDQTSIVFEQNSQSIKYYDATYTPYLVKGLINNQSFTINAA